MTGNWRNSTRCDVLGGCVDVASWRKSARCPEGPGCVETAQGPGVIGVRDSWPGNPGVVLEFPAGAWARFTSALNG